jgi:hypothetical protein
MDAVNACKPIGNELLAQIAVFGPYKSIDSLDFASP